MATGQVVIIGAGLAGLTLALALHQRSIPCIIYESRPEDVKIGGAVMLSPNALRALESIGAYSRIKDKSYHFEELNMETDTRVPLTKYYFGSEKLFGYKALRIYRQELIKVLVSMMKERGVPMEFEKKYQRVVSESADGVEVEFADGSIVKASILVGADGIHSKIREYISPGAQTTYLGQIAIAGAVKSSNVRLPSPDYRLPASIFGQPGVFILAPQHIDGSEMMAGTQYAFPELTKEETKAISSNPQRMIEMVNRNKKDWSDLVQSALENFIPESMYVWPFYSVPALVSWSSKAGKVVILGDAAHAIPPTLGQGANQAMEEGLGLAMVIEKTREGGFEKHFSEWAAHRKSRIGELMAMTRKMNNNRLPQEQREKLDPSELWRPDLESPGEEMRWIYSYDVKENFEKLSMV